MDFEPEKYEEQTIDTDEILGTDVKINPDFYIHTGILKAQAALTKDNVKEGFLQYRVLIEHIETLCKAASMIDPDYDTKLKEFKNNDEYKEITDDLVRMVRLSTYKLELLMKNVFSNKVATEPMKV